MKADAPWKTLQEFMAAAKANPGKIRVGSPGEGTISHLTLERWQIPGVLRGRWHHLAVAGALVNGVTLSAFHRGDGERERRGDGAAASLGPMLIALSAVPLLAATTVQLAAGALLTVALAVGLERVHAVWTVPAVTSVVWNVLAVSIRTMALYYYPLARGTAGRVAANLYLVPGTVAVAAWALLGERLTPLAVLGFAIASAGVFLVARVPGP